MQLFSISVLVIVLQIFNTAYGEICTSDICKYEFSIAFARTMTHNDAHNSYDMALNSTANGFVRLKNTHNRPSDPKVGTSVGLDEVIAADGYQRTIITINGQFPGPDIEVTEGAKVIVHVTNNLHSDAISIHWHGLLMRGSTWMDGVPDVSHCPIEPYHKFTYIFTAEPAGTHWYHSHVTRQRLYGFNGLFIVHPRLPLSLMTPYHLMSVGDWFKVDGHTHHILDPRSSNGTGRDLFAANKDASVLPDGTRASQLIWSSALINGKGRLDPNIKTPLTVFPVDRNQKYRFRMANVGSDYALSVSVDNHVLTVVATDGYTVEPITVEHIVIHVGETIDFELTANQSGSKFWLRTDTLSVNTELPNGARAIVQYNDSTGECDPTSTPRSCTRVAPCLVYNCGFDRYPASFNKTCINIEQVKVVLAQEKLNEEYGLNVANPTEIMLNMGTEEEVNFNGRNYIKPTTPPYQSDSKMVDCDVVCPPGGGYCRCTHKLNLNYMQPYRFIVSNYPTLTEVSGVNHPFHMHGHHFAVLHIGYPIKNRTTTVPVRHNPDVTCYDRVCSRPYWNPIRFRPQYDMTSVALKNTVVIPVGGYAVLQIRADNPGFWLTHCHMAAHQAAGMTLLIEEAPERITPPPKGFPSCYNYEPTDKQTSRYLESISSKITVRGNFLWMRSAATTSPRPGRTSPNSNTQRLNELMGGINNLFNNNKKSQLY